MPGIHAPWKLSTVERARIDDEFRRRLAAADPEWPSYVQLYLPRVIRRLAASSSSWKNRLAEQASKLYDVAARRGLFANYPSEPRARLIVVALHYLCDPHDVITDFAPADGYIDDAHVLNSVIHQLRTEAPELYQDVKA